jgi:hypothetical protein
MSADYFYFNDLDTTAYTILPALEGRWGGGGANSTDALLVASTLCNWNLNRHLP